MSCRTPSIDGNENYNNEDKDINGVSQMVFSDLRFFFFNEIIFFFYINTIVYKAI